jgi:hypothetical protein
MTLAPLLVLEGYQLVSDRHDRQENSCAPWGAAPARVSQKPVGEPVLVAMLTPIAQGRTSRGRRLTVGRQSGYNGDELAESPPGFSTFRAEDARRPRSKNAPNRGLAVAVSPARVTVAFGQAVAAFARRCSADARLVETGRAGDSRASAATGMDSGRAPPKVVATTPPVAAWSVIDPQAAIGGAVAEVADVNAAEGVQTSEGSRRFRLRPFPASTRPGPAETASPRETPATALGKRQRLGKLARTRVTALKRFWSI